MRSNRNSLGSRSHRDNLLRMGGQGIFSSIKNAIPHSDSNARAGYPGENHAILKLPNGFPGIANYMGPGTEVVKRLRRGDPPRTASDKTAMRHDIDYGLATMADSRSTQKRLVREADQRMVNKLQNIEQTGSDSRLNTLQGKKLIQAKMAMENKGLMRWDKFSGPLKEDKGDKPVLTQARDKLIQEGYGLHPAGRGLHPAGVPNPVKELRRLALRAVKKSKPKRVKTQPVVKTQGKGKKRKKGKQKGGNKPTPGGPPAPPMFNYKGRSNRNKVVVEKVLKDILPRLLVSRGIDIKDVPLEKVKKAVMGIVLKSKTSSNEELFFNIVKGLVPLLKKL